MSKAIVSRQSSDGLRETTWVFLMRADSTGCWIVLEKFEVAERKSKRHRWSIVDSSDGLLQIGRGRTRFAPPPEDVLNEVYQVLCAQVQKALGRLRAGFTPSAAERQAQARRIG